MSYQTVTTQPPLYPNPNQPMPYGGGYPPQGQTYQGAQMIPGPNQYQYQQQQQPTMEQSNSGKGGGATSCLAWCCCIYCCIKICCSGGEDNEMDDAECCAI